MTCVSLILYSVYIYFWLIKRKDKEMLFMIQATDWFSKAGEFL